ncbi:hypothetical protein C0J52_19040 [Blattella germanica]|nr:hypothetical protein C0J52_19040 [Blattella germanica]
MIGILDIVLLGDSEKILKDNMHILRINTRKLGLEEKRLRVFENKVLRKIFESHRLRWAGHVARIGNERGIRKRPVGRPITKEVDYTGDDWKTLVQDRDVWRACFRTAMNLRFR